MSTQETTVSAPNPSDAGNNTSTTQQGNSNTSLASAGSSTPAAGSQGQNSSQTPVSQQAEPVYDLKLSEGSTLSKEHLSQIASFAKENGLTPQQAQKILDRDQAYFEGQKKAAEEGFNQQLDSWVKQVQEDKALGGEKFAENMETAKRGFEKFSTPALKEILNKSGYGSHPEVVRMFYAIGKAMSEDSFQKGSPAGKDVSRAEIFYPSMKK